MPRKPRMYLAGMPFHVIQRGNNRNKVFFAEKDYSDYLDYLQDACRRYRVAVHAYVLMTNHVHLLMTPESENGISRVMQSLGRRYVQHINVKYGRTGTLFEGRHKACPVDSDSYFLTCMRYIEQNPIRAGMVAHPAGHRWSSYRTNTSSKSDPMVSPHPAYLALGHDSSRRLDAYHRLFEQPIAEADIERIRQSIQFSMPLGDQDFKQQIESLLGRSTGHAGPGRPKIAKKVETTN